jgi:hypothetical protein
MQKPADDIINLTGKKGWHESALVRLVADEFRCRSVCDEAMDIGRLHHDPATAFCLDHVQ